MAGLTRPSTPLEGVDGRDKRGHDAESVPHVKLPDSKDFWSGIMLIAIGAVAVFMARDYPFGTALRMGAGFFPVVLGVVLVLFGLFFAARGLRSVDKIEGNWSARGLIVLPLAFV